MVFLHWRKNSGKDCSMEVSMGWGKIFPENNELKIKQKRTEGTPELVLIICIHTLNESIKYSLMFKSKKLVNLV